MPHLCLLISAQPVVVMLTRQWNNDGHLAAAIMPADRCLENSVARSVDGVIHIAHSPQWHGDYSRSGGNKGTGGANPYGGGKGGLHAKDGGLATMFKTRRR